MVSEKNYSSLSSLNIMAEWVPRGLCVPLAFCFALFPTILFLLRLSNWYSQSCDFVSFCFHFASLCKWYRHLFSVLFSFHTRTTSRKKFVYKTKSCQSRSARCSGESALSDTFRTSRGALLILVIIILIQTGINICMNIIATNLRPPISSIARQALIRCLQFAHIFHLNWDAALDRRVDYY